MLSSFMNRRNAGRFVPVVLAGIILAACSVNQQAPAPVADIRGAANQGSAFYLQQMRQSTDDSRSDWQLLAIRALMAEGDFNQAGSQLQALPAQLTAAQKSESLLLKTQYAIHQQQMQQAATLLAALSPAMLNDSQQSRYQHLVIASASAEDSLTVLRAYIGLQPTLPAAEQQKNIDQTWARLLTISADQLGNQVINANENILQGWLDLLGVYYQNRTDQQNLKSAVQDWQQRYPDNPAAKTLPSALLQTINLSHASTQTIALFLPLTGPGAIFSKAIEQGLNDARNGRLTTPRVDQPAADAANQASSADTSPATTQTAPNPASNSAAAEGANATEVKVYDTNGHAIDQLLQQAQQEGATLVVGPLLKEDVAKAVAAPTHLNILALNQPSDLQDHPNVCYFSLSPENEARDAADHIWAQGKRQPVLLLPGNDLGDRIANAFASEWQHLGGATVLRQTLGNTSELRSKINANTGISLTGTPVAAANPSASLTVAGMTFDAPSRATDSQGDVDAVYIVANQGDLDLIKPLITMKIGTRSNVAFYANSLSSQANAGTDFRFEMEGLQYSDIPLLLGSNPQLQQQALGQFNNDYTLTRLYAMGIDAWKLANHFAELRQQAGYQLQGETGLLQATQNCVINRTLSWNQYIQGKIVPVH